MRVPPERSASSGSGPAHAALLAVRAEHVEGQRDLQGLCTRCGEPWPCGTYDVAGLDVPAFVRAWWEHHSLSSGTREQRLRAERTPNFTSYVVDEAIEDVPAEAVVLLRNLAEGAPDDDDALTIGAGPLEELFARWGHWLPSESGRSVLDAVEDAARQSSVFRRELGAVYFGDDIPPEVVHRVSRFLP